MHTKQTIVEMLVGLATVTTIAGCNSVIGLTQFTIDTASQDNNKADATVAIPDAAADEPPPPRGECDTNVQCTDRATEGSADGGVVPAICLKPEGKCVELLSEDCATVTGDYLNDNAIVVGTLFSVKGTQGPTNMPRQQSATLAADQINSAAVGGIPGPNGPRPYVMVSCDESTMPLRAAAHLVTDLRVPAIVGPNTSQDAIELSQKLTVHAGTVMMTPTAVASSIADLADNDLTWLMVPSDVQRAPLMIKQLNDLESAVKADTTNHVANAPVKLAIVFRDDALGQGTRASLNALTWNGKPITDPINYAGMMGSVRVEPYDPTWPVMPVDPRWTSVVDRLLAFAPDIVVVAGTAEGYTRIMDPLEKGWPMAVAKRPSYMVIDSTKVPQLLAGAAANADLRKRVRGTGVTSAGSSAQVLVSFNSAYQLARNEIPATSGMGPSYDAAYAIAYALAATKDLPVSGANVAKGLRKLAGGVNSIDVGDQRALKAFTTLAGGENITAIGTFGPLEWDKFGAPLGGTLEMWCIGSPTGMTATAASSGLTYDIKLKTFKGDYVQCP